MAILRLPSPLLTRQSRLRPSVMPGFPSASLVLFALICCSALQAASRKPKEGGNWKLPGRSCERRGPYFSRISSMPQMLIITTLTKYLPRQAERGWRRRGYGWIPGDQSAPLGADQRHVLGG